MRAVWASLPPAFENDGDGKKATWRKNFRVKLEELVSKEAGNRLSRAEKRHPGYEDAESIFDVDAPLVKSHTVKSDPSAPSGIHDPPPPPAPPPVAPPAAAAAGRGGRGAPGGLMAAIAGGRGLSRGAGNRGAGKGCGRGGGGLMDAIAARGRGKGGGGGGLMDAIAARGKSRGRGKG